MLKNFRKFLESNSEDEIGELRDLFNEMEDDPIVDKIEIEVVPFNKLEDRISIEKGNFFDSESQEFIAKDILYSVKVFIDLKIDMGTSKNNWKIIQDLDKGLIKNMLLCFSGEKPLLDMGKESEFIKWIESISNFRLIRFNGFTWGVHGRWQMDLKLGLKFGFLELK